ncbi:MAG: glycosyltransferase family 4 protein [Novosphingobium sp.]
MKLSEFSSGPVPVENAAVEHAPTPAIKAGRIAYLVNVYPAVSHSFIQTEIAALERLGLEVSRFTIRRAASGLSSDDLVEAERTSSLLEGNKIGLVRAVTSTFLRHPAKSVSAMWHSLRGAGSGVRGLAYFAEAAALAQQLERQGIRHVHAHFGTNPVAVARLASRLAPVTYSFTAHGPDEFDSPRALDLPGKIADAAFVAGVSSFGRSQLMRWADPAHWDRIKAVRCAVAPHFLQAPADPASGYSTSRLVCVARLSAQKGLPLLMEAASQVAKTHGFTIDVIGDGVGRAVLEKMIARLGLEHRVRLLGWRSPQAVREALSQARGFVLPSFAEGLPVVLMEALALGKPVVATSIAGIPELVDPANGWLVPAGSVDALAEAIKALLDASPARLMEMGREGQDRVRRMHDPDNNARQLAELFAPLV